MSFTDSYEEEDGVVPVWRPIEFKVLSRLFGLTPEWWVGVLEAQDVPVTEAMVNDWIEAKQPIPEKVAYSLASVLSMTANAVQSAQLAALECFQNDESLLLSLPSNNESFWKESPEHQGLPVEWLESVMGILIATLPPNAVRILPQDSLKN